MPHKKRKPGETAALCEKVASTFDAGNLSAQEAIDSLGLTKDLSLSAFYGWRSAHKKAKKTKRKAIDPRHHIFPLETPAAEEETAVTIKGSPWAIAKLMRQWQGGGHDGR